MSAFRIEKRTISLICISCINLLFAYKYLHRITEWALAISCAYFLFFLLAAYFFVRSDHKFLRSRNTFIASIFIYSILAFILWSIIDIHQLNVDRWSVISSFWQWAGEGKYPYLAKSHMGNHPGPLPVYFLITWPFLKLGELGLFTLSGIILFSVFLYFRSTVQKANLSLFLLIISLALAWELVTRSTLFTNAVLFLLGIHWLLELNLKNKKHLLFSALLAALLFSTRTIFVIPLIIFGFYKLKISRKNLKDLFIWSLFIILFFVFTFVPFIVNYPNDFWQTNPFTIQSRLLPVYFTPAIILFAALLGWFSKNKVDVIFYSGVGFLTTVIIYFMYVTAITSLYDAFFNSVADISYLLFSLPFFLYSFSIENKKVF